MNDPARRMNVNRLLIVAFLMLAVPGWGETCCPLCSRLFPENVPEGWEIKICDSCKTRSALATQTTEVIIDDRYATFGDILAELQAIRKLLEELKPITAPEIDYPLLHPEVYEHDQAYGFHWAQEFPELRDGKWFWNKVYRRWECWKGNQCLYRGGK